VPDAILHKPGPLNDEEWVIMRRHPVYAYQLLAPIGYLQGSLDIPHYHQIICISCGRIGSFHECAWHDGMKIDDFTLVSHIVQLQGICASCASPDTET